MEFSFLIKPISGVAYLAFVLSTSKKPEIVSELQNNLLQAGEVTYQLSS